MEDFPIWGHILAISLDHNIINGQNQHETKKMTGYIKKTPTQAYSLGKRAVEKITLFYSRLRRNTKNILTISSSYVQHSEKMKRVMLKSGSKMMIRFGL